MQVAILTASREAEHKMLGVLDELSKINASVEGKILSENCNREHLRLAVEDSLADVFLVGSSMANTLSAHVANFANGRPVIGVPLSGVKDPEAPIYREKPIPIGLYTITKADDVTSAAELAATILTNLKEARA